MARSTQQKTLGIKDVNGDPWSGQTVQLVRGASTYNLAEVGTSGFYLISAIPPNEYEVYVNSNPQNEFIQVGAGGFDSVDSVNNPNSYLGTDENGAPILRDGPTTSVRSLTINGTSGVTGDIDTDAVYLRDNGVVVEGNIPVWSADTQLLEDSSYSSADLAKIDVNEANIDINTSNIATNTSNIATNTSNIATNASNISTNDTLALHKAGQEKITGEKLSTKTLASRSNYVINYESQTPAILNTQQLDRGTAISIAQDCYTLLNIENTFGGLSYPTMSYDNGLSWERLTTVPVSISSAYFLKQNPYTGRYFYGTSGAGGAIATYFYSDDLITWTSVTITGYDSVQSIAFTPTNVIFGLGFGTSDADIVVSADDGVSVGTPVEITSGPTRVLDLFWDEEDELLYACLGTTANSGNIFSSPAPFSVWTNETNFTGIEVVRQLIKADNGNHYFVTGSDATDGDVYIVTDSDFSSPVQIGLDTNTLTQIDNWGPVIATTDKSFVYISYDYFVTYEAIAIDVFTRNDLFGFTSTGRLLWGYNTGDLSTNSKIYHIDVGVSKSDHHCTTHDKLSVGSYEQTVSKYRNRDGTYRHDYGTCLVEPTATPNDDDTYFNSTSGILFVGANSRWNAVVTCAIGQLSVKNNVTAQTGIGTTYIKVNQFTTNGNDEGGVVSDVTNKEIDVYPAKWEITFGGSMTGSNTTVYNFAVFDVADTGFTTPLVVSSRKVGTGSDVGSFSQSEIVTISSSKSLALYVKADGTGKSLTLQSATFKIIKVK